MAHLSDNGFASVIIAFLSTVALCLYSIVVWALCVIYKKSKNDFYILLITQGVLDCCLLCAYVFYSSPSTFIGRPLLGDLFEEKFLGTVNNLLYFSGTAMYMNIGLNRYCSICRDPSNASKYSKRRTVGSVCLCLSFGALSSIPQMTPCCVLKYFRDVYFWSYDMELPGNHIYVWYDRLVVSSLLPLVVLYSLIVKRIRTLRVALAITRSTASDQRRSRKDQKLALQAAIIFTLALASGLAFTIVPMVTWSKWAFLGTTTLYIVTLGAAPVVYIMFNQQVKDCVSRLLTSGQSNDGSQNGPQS